jgi:hypothetical protein
MKLLKRCFSLNFKVDLNFDFIINFNLYEMFIFNHYTFLLIKLNQPNLYYKGRVHD